MPVPAKILSWLVWLPVAAGVVVLLLGERRIVLGRWIALAATLATLGLCVPLWCGVRPHDAVAAVRRTRILDRCAERLVSPRHRRHRDAAHRADGLYDAARRDRRLVEHRQAAGAVLRLLPRDGRTHDRRVLRRRCAPFLRILGSDADPDVPDHRDLGRRAPRLRHHQVFPVHLPRLGPDARRAHLAVPRRRKLRDRRHAAVADRHDRAGPHIPRILRRIRSQGADVARAHLVA